MPALSDYTAGTITLTNGSTAFTGSGTGWQAADFREGDTILGIEANGGAEYVVATITGNAAGTLTQPWEGASGTYTYRMRYLADGARVTAQARELIELLGNGNLQAEAGLTGAANTLSYYTGPAAKALTPLTPFARTLLDDANATAARDTLDVAQKQSSLTDATTGLGMLVGAFGLGSTGAPAPAVAHVDDISATGIYYVGVTVAGLPEPIVSHVINIRQNFSSGRHWQLCKPVTSHNFYTRYCFNGVWGTWQRIMYRSDILGTVSQAGGVPTGGIFERGSNANGEYVRFADGTQICYFTDPNETTSSTQAGSNGNYCFGPDIHYATAAVFIDIPTLSTFYYGTNQNPIQAEGRVTGTSTNNVVLRVIGMTTSSRACLGYIAIGRWF